MFGKMISPLILTIFYGAPFVSKPAPEATFSSGGDI